MHGEPDIGLRGHEGVKFQRDLRLREAGKACATDGSGDARLDEAATLDHEKLLGNNEKDNK